MKTILLLSTLALCAAGSVRAVEDPPAPDSASGAKEAAGRPDAWITGKVKSALLFHKSVSALNTEVDTADGVVTLRGAAANQAQKDLATEYAADIEGVKKVDNRMTVKGERTMETRVDDVEITTQVKAALLTRRSTSALNTSVKTTDGIVTLSGLARNAAEKELAEKLARGVRGVREVDNRMIVE